jgi:hypothetical protein
MLRFDLRDMGESREAIDTTTSAVRMMMPDGRGLRRIRTGHAAGTHQDWSEAAGWDGRIGGRPPKLTAQQQTEIARMISRGRKSG